MLSAQEIETYLAMLDPWETILKKAVEAGEEIEDISGLSEDRQQAYLREFEQAREVWIRQGKGDSISSITLYREMERFRRMPGVLTGRRERLIGRKHMTHEDYRLDTRNNIQIIKHCRYSKARLHDHEFIEISYVLTGSCRHEILFQGKQVPLDLAEGNLIILPPGMKHQIAVFDDSVILNILVNRHTFYQVFLQDLPKENLLYQFFWRMIFSGEESSYLTFDPEEKSGIKKTVLDLVAVYLEEGVYAQEICGHFLSILFLRLMEQAAPIARQPAAEASQVLPMILYIQRHYREASLKKIAEDFHYSMANVNRIFKKYTGTTVRQYIMELRLQQGEELLTKTERSVEQIAEDVGYQDVSYFITRFKRRYGKTPLQYRRDAEKNMETNAWHEE